MNKQEKALKGLKNCADGAGRCIKCVYYTEIDCSGAMAKDVLEMLNERPEQKHGHWIRSPGFKPDWKCSVCNGTYFGNARLFKFCPDCGASMDEEVQE